MNKVQILILALGAVLVIILFRLPRVVVENEQQAQVDAHDFQITDKDA